MSSRGNDKHFRSQVKQRWDLKEVGGKSHAGISGHDEIVLIVSNLFGGALTIGWDRGTRS